MKSKLPKSSPSLSTTSSAEKADEQQRNVVVQDDDDEKKEEVATPPIVGTPPGMHNSPRMQPLPISPITLRMESEQQQPSQQQTDGNHPNNNVMTSPSRVRYASPPGRRTIQLRLLELNCPAPKRCKTPPLLDEDLSSEYCFARASKVSPCLYF